jgi:hypothetical protein
MFMILLVAFKFIPAPIQFSAWIAEPSWVTDPVARRGFEADMQTSVGMNLSIRAITEDGQVFFTRPASFWSIGKCHVCFDSSGPGKTPIYDLTFRLPDGTLVAGGSGRLNGFPDYGRPMSPGSFFKDGVYKTFQDNYYITAVAPSGKVAGMAVNNNNDKEDTLREVPCRIVNGKAIRLALPKVASFEMPTPCAINDKGTIITGDVGYTNSYAEETFVWDADDTMWTTSVRFPSNDWSIVFTNLSNDDLFVGCQQRRVGSGDEREVVEEPIVSNGKVFRKLAKLSDFRSSRVTHFYRKGYLGSFLTGVAPRYFPHGCIWIDEKPYKLQDLLTSPLEWQIGRVAAINKRGQLAVAVWKLVRSAEGDKIINSFGVLTPVK